MGVPNCARECAPGYNGLRNDMKEPQLHVSYVYILSSRSFCSAVTEERAASEEVCLCALSIQDVL